MIDSHCHLDHEPMYSDLKNVLNRSKDSGVEKFYQFAPQMTVFIKLLKLLKSIQLYMEHMGFIHMKLVLTLLRKRKLLKMLVQIKKL